MTLYLNTNIKKSTGIAKPPLNTLLTKALPSWILDVLGVSSNLWCLSPTLQILCSNIPTFAVFKNVTLQCMHQSTKRHITKILSLHCLICCTHREEVIKCYSHIQDSSQYAAQKLDARAKYAPYFSSVACSYLYLFMTSFTCLPTHYIPSDCVLKQ
jgi:hypothetical protein